MAVKAAPMITPTARSRTLPRRMNLLNPSSMAVPPPPAMTCCRCPTHTTLRRRGEYTVLWELTGYRRPPGRARAARAARAGGGGRRAW
jgi:hypothetical protein